MANYNPYTGWWNNGVQYNPVPYITTTPGTVNLAPSGPITERRSSGIIWVQGQEGAKAFNDIRPGESVCLFDSENPVIYIKSVDMSGRPQEMKIYDLIERQSTTTPMVPPIDTTKFVARDELDSFVENKVKEIMKRNKNGKKGDAK